MSLSEREPPALEVGGLGSPRPKKSASELFAPPEGLLWNHPCSMRRYGANAPGPASSTTCSSARACGAGAGAPEHTIAHAAQIASARRMIWHRRRVRASGGHAGKVPNYCRDTRVACAVTHKTAGAAVRACIDGFCRLILSALILMSTLGARYAAPKFPEPSPWNRWCARANAAANAASSTSASHAAAASSAPWPARAARARASSVFF